MTNHLDNKFEEGDWVRFDGSSYGELEKYEKLDLKRVEELNLAVENCSAIPEKVEPAEVFQYYQTKIKEHEGIIIENKKSMNKFYFELADKFGEHR